MEYVRGIVDILNIELKRKSRLQSHIITHGDAGNYEFISSKRNEREKLCSGNQID